MNKEKFLGKRVGYESKYNPDLLVFEPRLSKRKEIGYNSNDDINFYGFDIWNQYEVSWLDNNGKPIVKIGKLIYSSTTDNIVESKSLKLYFNSFNMTKFNDENEVINIIKNDLKKGLNDNELDFKLYDVDDNFLISGENDYEYKLIDNYKINVDIYSVTKELLKVNNNDNKQNNMIALKSNLLKSNCLVTHQPDWATIYIKYIPNDKTLDEESLLRYIISFREHNEFHEQCVERIYHDLFEVLNPIELTVFGKYTRRGGIDINPFRCSNENLTNNFKTKLKEEIFYREAKQ